MDTNDLNLPRLGASSTSRLLRNRALLHSDETDRIIGELHESGTSAQTNGEKYRKHGAKWPDVKRSSAIFGNCQVKTLVAPLLDPRVCDALAVSVPLVAMP